MKLITPELQAHLMQEVTTLAVVAVYYLGGELRWNFLAAGFCLITAVGFIFIPAR